MASSIFTIQVVFSYYGELQADFRKIRKNTQPNNFQVKLLKRENPFSALFRCMRHSGSFRSGYIPWNKM
jgi:hypothetical protein